MMQFIETYNLTGIIIGLATFLIIGLFHPLVIKGEYYFGVKIWWAFLLIGIAGIIGSVLIQNIILSIICGVTAFSAFWGIGELFEQRKRVEKGWFPKRKTKNTLLIAGFLFLATSLQAQTSEKLQPDNIIKIIGTAYSVDYNTNLSSTTINTKADAFDGDFDTYFASYDRSNTWVGLDLGAPHIITQVAYAPRQTHAQRLVMGVLEGANSPDFGDAVLLGLITTQPVERRMTTQNINNSRGFRYVRYVGPNNVRCNIAELAFYGYPGEGDDSHLAQTTNIPDVIIHTTDCQDILDRENYIKGIVSFISGDGATFYTDSVEIRGRGNYSWTSFDKKPYRIKLAEKTNVLGFPAEARNWTLISNHSDKTLMRNLLAFDLSKRMEMPYTPAGRPVNLYLNGEYKGCYQLCDHIDVRKKRVDVKEMKITDISGENLTGGYLIEADAYAKSEPKYFTSNRNTNVTIKSPDSEEITTQQFNYIRNHFNLLESTLYASTYTNPTTGFRKHLDTKTFIRHFLVGELSGNTDTYWSTYFYKQRNDDKFYVGPVWDFDIAFENDNRTYPINNYPDFIFRKGSVVGDMRNFVNRLLSDTQLYNELKQTYADYRDWGYLTEEELMQTIDDYAAEMETSQQLNFTRWDVLNKRIHQNNQPAGSYTGEVNVVKNYLKNRLIWMDNKLNYVPNPNNKPTFLESAKQSSIAVWTESNRIHVEGVSASVRIEIVNWMGQIVERRESQQAFSVAVPQGIYILRGWNKEGARQMFKCVVP